MDDAAQYLIDLAVFIACETGWPLDDILDMPLGRLELIAESISWRVQTRNYDEWSRAAMIAMILMRANGAKIRSVEKLIGKPPKRNPGKSTIEEGLKLAKERGIGPSGKSG